MLTRSVGGHKAYPHTGHYMAAKHGVIGLMRTLAVTFRLFAPHKENADPEDFAPVSQMMHTLPIPRVESEDVRNAVLFLASPESRYVTGVALPVDAGALLK